MATIRPRLQRLQQRHSPQLQQLDRWAIERLSPTQIDFLATWPLRIDIDGPDGQTLTICHATPWSAHPVVGPDASDETASEMLDKFDSSAVAYGHIHVQYEREVDGKLLCSVGSIGAPFDGDPRAAYAVLTNDGDGWSVAFRRVAYDVDAAVDALLTSTLPNKKTTAEVTRTGRRAG